MHLRRPSVLLPLATRLRVRQKHSRADEVNTQFLTAHLARHAGATPAECPVLASWPSQERPTASFDYEAFYTGRVTERRRSDTYRVFPLINRDASEPPYATLEGANGDEARKVIVWCSNDYLNMSRHPAVVEATVDAVRKYGAGSGGTRNISGTHALHSALERELASLHGQQNALLFPSCYTANDEVLTLLLRSLPESIVFSDQENHRSIIEGIRRHGQSRKHVFRHNDVQDLERLLKIYDFSTPKIVVFESVYSMSGSIAPMAELCKVARQYGALTMVDEVHAVGLYGEQGAGLSEVFGLTRDIDIVTGTLAKAYGLNGGYLAASAGLVDMVRCYAPGFIFTTSLAPHTVAGALAAVRHLRTHTEERTLLHRHVAYCKEQLRLARLPVRSTSTSGVTSHVVPVLVGNSTTCRRICELLLEDHSAYVQPINHPTVPHGKEMLRLAPGPAHTPQLIDQFVAQLLDVWKRLDLPLE